MNGRLIDTNILIYLSKREIELESFSSRDTKLYISVITYMEALGYPFVNSTEKSIIEQLCSHIEIVNLNQDIIDKVIEIRQRKKIKLPDAIILSTAINLDLDLVTANVGDFMNIEAGLRIINPLK
jgi:predicted nucleic acid-binding protein